MRPKRRLAILITSGLLTVGMAAQSAQVTRASFNDKAGLTVVAVYPGSAEKMDRTQDGDDRATLSLNNLSVHSAWGRKYISADSADKVLAFYRGQMKGLGLQAECTDGGNTHVSVSLGDDSASQLTSCHRQEFGAGETELKAGQPDDFLIVTVRPMGHQSEYTLVRVQKEKGKHLLSL